jgi:hypothetical protein
VTKTILTISTAQTLPFGIASVLAPEWLFLQFGVLLDPSGQLVAQGYGATLIALGIALWALRGVQLPQLHMPLLVGVLAFNSIETAVQALGGMAGIAKPIIFGNVGLHAVMATWCAVAIVRVKR